MKWSTRRRKGHPRQDEFRKKKKDGRLKCPESQGNTKRATSALVKVFPVAGGKG